MTVTAMTATVVAMTATAAASTADVGAVAARPAVTDANAAGDGGTTCATTSGRNNMARRRR